MLIPVEAADEGTEFRILEWHVGEGDECDEDALVLEIETDKNVLEVRTKQKAVLRKVVVAEGDWSKPGAVLAVFSDTPADPLPEDPTRPMEPLRIDAEEV